MGAIAATAAIAFAITAVAMTGTELVTGGSIGKGSHKTTLWGGGKDSAKDRERQDTTVPSDDQDRRQTAPQGQQTAPQDQQRSTPKTQPQPTTPQEQPQKTTPVPAPPAPTTTTP